MDRTILRSWNNITDRTKRRRFVVLTIHLNKNKDKIFICKFQLLLSFIQWFLVQFNCALYSEKIREKGISLFEIEKSRLSSSWTTCTVRAVDKLVWSTIQAYNIEPALVSQPQLCLEGAQTEWHSSQYCPS